MGNTVAMQASDGNEPRTPMWLPALGAVLFLTVGLIWGLGSSKTDSTQDSAKPATTAAVDAGVAQRPH
ncbi:MAG TPA: hypothetical protein VIF62_16740 [Labilithrix sp.]|jgi:hypothetical protein